MGGLNNLIAQLRCYIQNAIILKGCVIVLNFNDLLQKVIHSYCFLLLRSFKKNILCVINAFKNRGLQNEPFMNIQ